MKLIASVSALLLGLLVAGCNGEVVIGGQRPARLVLVSGDLQTGTVGQELPAPLVVRVLDDKDRPVRNQLVNFVVTAGGGSVFAGSALTNSDGEARERWTLGPVAAHTQRVEARAVNAETGAALVFGEFRAVAVPDAPAQASGVISGTFDAVPDTPVPNIGVKVTDRYGNPLSGVTVNWSVTSGGGTVAAPSTQTGASGFAVVEWRLGNVPGVQTLRGQAGSLPPVEFSARLRLPVTIAFVAAPAVVPVNGSAEFAVAVRDSMAQLIPNTLVEWTLTGAGGTLTPVSARTASDGTARATLAVGTAQTNFTVTARAGNAQVQTLTQVDGPILITDLSAGGSRGSFNPNGGATARIVSSAGAITSAQVTIYGRSAPMTFNAAEGKWVGSVMLSDAPGGTLEGNITAQDAAGNTRVLTFTVVNDANPVVTILEPGSNTVSAKGSIRIRATCSSYAGRRPELCADLYSRVSTDAATYLPSARGRTEVDVVVPLPAGPATVHIYVSWTDAHGVYYNVLKMITVNVQP
ncbi:Ig-like domain-containing protein [Longimicrobium terrae]|uniref:Big-1 domain-containing protein n=1 Tax=Longimicrobium terrae TaxID=1639882 RepID=A0A841GX99_9BACT|nr:Ig-like domain-containing protein [Longimicrobium terrae]MBB4635282.1 hypothetical protein [Longimicrobium terrae]MBB6069676.1 hypothetical protein [Longimicrobium terrae]NNC31113.1 Ig-like domain-containing protein [Longimicrobium terrae]